MRTHLKIAIKLTLVLTVLLGLVYPLLVTGIARVVFPRQAGGSLIRKNGKIIGSELIGQSFDGPGYFHPRPSAAFDPNPSKNKHTRPDPYVSGGSNLAPTSKALADRVKDDVASLTKTNPRLRAGKIPADMGTASASGLDPDISPANALAQVPRVAKARKMSDTKLRTIIRSHMIKRQFGILGEPRVNVLSLNLALDAEDN